MPDPKTPSRLAQAAPFVAGARATRHWRVISLLLFVVVMVLALMPQVPTEFSTGWDKLNHALAFCALAFAWRLGFPGGGWRWVQLGLALLGTGGAIEIVQQFVPGRQADWADLLADAIGAGIGMSMVATVEWLVRPAAARLR